MRAEVSQVTINTVLRVPLSNSRLLQTALSGLVCWLFFIASAAPRKGLAQVGHSGFHAVGTTWIFQYNGWDFWYPACFRYKIINLLAFSVPISSMPTSQPRDLTALNELLARISSLIPNQLLQQGKIVFNTLNLTNLDTSLCLYI